MTPAEFEALTGVNAKSLRRHLRARWPHEHGSSWVLDSAMLADACSTFKVSVGGSGTAQPRPGRGLSNPATPRTPSTPRRSSGLHHELLVVAQRSGIPLRLGTSLKWLTGRGHLNQTVQATASHEVLEALAMIHHRLGGDTALLGSKRPGNPPTPDLVHDELGCIIEVDEVQHFTTARLQTLDMYPGSMALGFKPDEYRQLIERWSRQGDRAFAHKTAIDFPSSGGRQAQRAYNDSIRDLLAPTFTSLPVIRIPAPDRSMASALTRLRAALDEFS